MNKNDTIQKMPRDVAATLNSYPKAIREKLLLLRQLIYETANDSGNDVGLQECLKWGEPSYLSEDGSTIRMAWKSKQPDQYAMYFNCKSKLIATFSELYGDKFSFENNRAIVFREYDELPIAELKHCISLALNYHKNKHLPLLGA